MVVPTAELASVHALLLAQGAENSAIQAIPVGINAAQDFTGLSPRNFAIAPELLLPSNTIIEMPESQRGKVMVNLFKALIRADSEVETNPERAEDAAIVMAKILSIRPDFESHRLSDLEIKAGQNIRDYTLMFGPNEIPYERKDEILRFASTVLPESMKVFAEETRRLRKRKPAKVPRGVIKDVNGAVWKLARVIDRVGYETQAKAEIESENAEALKTSGTENEGDKVMARQDVIYQAA